MYHTLTTISASASTDPLASTRLSRSQVSALTMTSIAGDILEADPSKNGNKSNRSSKSKPKPAAVSPAPAFSTSNGKDGKDGTKESRDKDGNLVVHIVGEDSNDSAELKREGSTGSSSDGKDNKDGKIVVMSKDGKEGKESPGKGTIGVGINGEEVELREDWMYLQPHLEALADKFKSTLEKAMKGESVGSDGPNGLNTGNIINTKKPISIPIKSIVEAECMMREIEIFGIPANFPPEGRPPKKKLPPPPPIKLEREKRERKPKVKDVQKKGKDGDGSDGDSSDAKKPKVEKNRYITNSQGKKVLAKPAPDFKTFDLLREDMARKTTKERIAYMLRFWKACSFDGNFMQCLNSDCNRINYRRLVLQGTRCQCNYEEIRLALIEDSD